MKIDEESETEDRGEGREEEDSYRRSDYVNIEENDCNYTIITLIFLLIIITGAIII